MVTGINIGGGIEIGGSINVTTPPSAPVANDFTTATYQYDTGTYTIAMAPWIDYGYTSLTITTPPTIGTAVVNGLNIDYTTSTAHATSTSPDSIQYTATNGVGTSNIGTITIPLACNCVVAHALTSQGLWTARQNRAMNMWGASRLDQYVIGRALHRGYNIIAPKVVTPYINKKGTLVSRYLKWSFDNSTNMLRGKKFNVLSLPNSMLWVGVMTIAGFFVSEKTSKNSIQQHNKNLKGKNND